MQQFSKTKWMMSTRVLVVLQFVVCFCLKFLRNGPRIRFSGEEILIVECRCLLLLKGNSFHLSVASECLVLNEKNIL